MRGKSGSDRHYERREQAARRGAHLPSEDDLLMGMSFCGSDPERDLREYAGRLGTKLRRKPDPRAAALIVALDEAAITQDAATLEAILAGVGALEASGGRTNKTGGQIGDCRLRCHVYLAHLGVASSCTIVAGETANYAHRRALGEEDRLTLLSRSLGWASLAAAITRMQAKGHAFRGRADVEVEMAASQFRSLMMEATYPAWEGHGSSVGTSVPATAATKKVPSGSIVANGTDDARSVIVMPRLGNAVGKVGKDVEREFKGVLSVALPLPGVPDLDDARRKLTSDFPWAAGVADAMLGDLVGRSVTQFRPTIFVGPPGCGKTAFIKALATEAGLPSELVSCGGMNDSALGGTPRRWTTGEPSLPVEAIRRHLSAGPAILLDEVEKASTNRHNGALADVLLGMLGRETASAYHDPYIEAEVDLSHISWLMTANSVGSLQAPLRDRCRVVRFPEPGPGHLPHLARRLLERHLVETGHDVRWAIPLEGYELDALAATWKGGSIRRLERLVEGLAEARSRTLAST